VGTKRILYKRINLNGSPSAGVLADETTGMIEVTQASASRFDGLVDRQARFVFRVAYALLRNSHDADDVVQETFLKIYRGGQWEAIVDERAFLARVAWRVAVDKLRSRARAPGPLDADLEPCGDMSPEEALVTADWNAAVHRLVDALPPKLRQPLALSTVEEMTSREIAQVMGIAEGTVRTRILRAREILKLKLAGLMESRYEKRRSG
jgi:RNA polymerase sigma-70 factor (ECF subfamily)